MASYGGYLKSSAIKVPFRVLYATSKEDGYPAEELEVRNPWLLWSLFIMNKFSTEWGSLYQWLEVLQVREN